MSSHSNREARGYPPGNFAGALAIFSIFKADLTIYGELLLLWGPDLFIDAHNYNITDKFLASGVYVSCFLYFYLKHETGFAFACCVLCIVSEEKLKHT